MDAVAGAVRSPVRREAGKLLVPVGITVTLIAVIGDLVAHTLDPLAHEHEELVVLSARGNSPWHLLLFAGILVTAVGAIRWANHLGSDWGNLLGAAMVLLLVAAVGLGTWAGWQARTPSVTLASGAGSQAAGAHVHTAAADAVPANARAGEASSGAEGASITGHVHGTPGSVSPQESQILSRQIAAAKSATAKYRSLAAAKADGYIQVTQFIPGLGLHLANLGISNRIFDPARPQVLLYQPDRSGKLVLVGVAYSIAHTGLDDPQPAGFAGNADVCAQPCRKMGGYFQAKTAWLLHAWIWKTNPDGLFTENNPSVF